MSRSYLSLIPQRELLEQIERYRVACNFRVTGNPLESNSDIFVVEIEAGNTKFEFGFTLVHTNDLRRFIVTMDVGVNENVYVQQTTRIYYPGIRPLTIHGQTKRQEVEFIPLRSQSVLLTVPWCYELREVFVRALEYLSAITHLH